MNAKIRATILVGVFCVAVVLGFRAFRPDPAELLKKHNAERSKGSEKAPLWITEYFDYQCPPCAIARGTLEEAMAAHPGQIYLQVRFFPLPGHKNGMKAATYGDCVARQKGAFWKFHEEMFKHQEEWAMDNYAPFKFVSYAEGAGADLKRLDACVQDPETEKTVNDEKKKAEEVGVSQTPTFYVNNKMVVGANGLKNEIDAYFNKEKKTP